MNPENQRPSAESIQTSVVEDADVFVHAEAIVAIDILGATTTYDLFGWRAVGRRVRRDLRQLLTSIGPQYGLQSLRSTGDGYLLTYRAAVTQAAEPGVVNALEASFALLATLTNRNQHVPEHEAIHVGCALHYHVTTWLIPAQRFF